MRNDRNKKRKPKQEGCVSSQQSEELTGEEENMIAEIVSAHSVTLNSVCDEDLAKVKYKTSNVTHWYSSDNSH